ncbi:CBO0543 family protein [Niallia sp. JL1B1071]|uniref:CBO0543 family protein n=1 Tax=Niallia tiangongensis TaxID=3237105 RepID=UPI0037DD3E8A
MNKELVILFLSWITCLFLLIKFIPKEKKRYFQIIFLVAHATAWIVQYIQVNIRVVSFPYREFEHATKMSFSLYYLVLPTFAVFFMLYYPEKKNWMRVLIHYLLFSNAMHLYMFLVERHTELIHDINWHWWFAVSIDIFILYLVKTFAFWFRKGFK